MKKLLLITATIFFIQMGNAQVSFKSNGQEISSKSSWDIRLVDIDGDNDLDAYFENKIWLNDSLGNFTKTDSSFGANDAYFADFNGDSFTDVVCSDSIFLNNGSYQYLFSGIIPSPMEMIYAQPIDIEGDGDIDIIVGDQTTDSLLINDGTGLFTNAKKSFGGWSQARYSDGDVNGDGFKDIYVSIPHIPPMGGHTPNLIWLGDGAGNFTQKSHNIAGAESRGVDLTDFDADGDLDLYVSDATKWGRVFINDGNGNFTDSGQKLGSRAGDAKAADFNNDGNSDLFICQGDGNGVTGNGAPSVILLGNGNGQFTDSKVQLQIGNTNSMALDAGDINNDGKTDVVVVNVKLDAQNGYIPMSCPVEIWLNSTFICDYFGQTPPGHSAVMFASGIISRTDRLEAKVAFSPDGNECYFEVVEINDNKASYKIYYTKRINNSWTEQVEATFSVNNSVGSPYFSADGKKLYYIKYNSDQTSSDIWMVQDSAGGWSYPQCLPEPINSASMELSCSETTDSIKYFSSKRPEGYGGIDIWYKKPLSNIAENVGSIVNTASYDFSPCIAPDGSYLIFASDRYGQEGMAQLYISFDKGNGLWTAPIDMNSGGCKSQ